MPAMVSGGFDPSAKGRLTTHDVGRFPSDRLFDRIGRAVCQAGCLPRKELYEAWEVARRVRRHCRGGRIVDLGGGHGLLAAVLLLLDDSSPSGVIVDRALPASCAKIRATLEEAWPRLRGRLSYEEREVAAAVVGPGDLVVSCHACGALTDVVIGKAIDAGARVAVLPCCHDDDRADTGGLDGWIDADLAIDIGRAQRLAAAGYRIWTQMIPAAITPKNRLLIARPNER